MIMWLHIRKPEDLALRDTLMATLWYRFNNPHFMDKNYVTFLTEEGERQDPNPTCMA